MRFKVGNDWYEATPDTPIMVELTEQDKHNISNMHPNNNRYAIFTSATKTEEMTAWMEAGARPYVAEA